MYRLLRQYGVHSLSSLAGALMFTYGSFLSYEFVHLGYINTIVWFPWQLLMIKRLFNKPGLLYSVMLGFLTAFSFLGGHLIFL